MLQQNTINDEKEIDSYLLGKSLKNKGLRIK